MQQEFLGVIPIFMNGDISQYAVGLQFTADIIQILVGTNALIYLTIAILIGEVFIRGGDLRKVELPKYAAIAAMYALICFKTVDIQLVRYDPINPNEYGNGTSVETVRNVPFAPAFMLSLVYNIHYQLAVLIDRSAYFSKNRTPDGTKGKLFDKIDEYADLLSGKIDDPVLSMETATFIKNVFIPDLETDTGNSFYNVVQNYNIDGIVKKMYMGDSSFCSLNAINDHSSDILYKMIENDKTGNKIYVINSDQLNSKTRNIPHEPMLKGVFFVEMRLRLSQYFEATIDTMARNNPNFFLTSDYENMKSIANTNGNYKVPEQLRDFLIATALNSKTSAIQSSMDIEDLYALTKASVVQYQTAFVKAGWMKMIYTTIIDNLMLAMIFAFPVIYICIYVKYLLHLVRGYFMAFLTLSIAFPLGYYFECLMDIGATNTMGNKIAGSIAGISPTIQQSIMQSYNSTEFVLFSLYIGFIGVVFSFGSTMMAQIGGHVVNDMSKDAGMEVPQILTGNQSFESRQYGDIAAMNTSMGNTTMRSWDDSGYSSWQKNDFVDRVNGMMQGGMRLEQPTIDQLTENGFHYSDGRLNGGGTLDEQARQNSFLRKLADNPQFTGNIIQGGILHQALLDSANKMAEYSGYGSAYSEINSGTFGKFMFGKSMGKYDAFSKMLDIEAPNIFSHSKGAGSQAGWGLGLPKIGGFTYDNVENYNKAVNEMHLKERLMEKMETVKNALNKENRHFDNVTDKYNYYAGVLRKVVDSDPIRYYDKNNDLADYLKTITSVNLDMSSQSGSLENMEKLAGVKDESRTSESMMHLLGAFMVNEM